MTSTTELGVGLSYRPHLRRALLDGRLHVDHVELAVEFNVSGGRISPAAQKLAAAYPVVLHGVSQSFGSTHFPLRDASTDAVQRLTALSPRWSGDHISLSGDGQSDSRLLLPPHRTKDVAHTIARNITGHSEVTGLPVVVEYIACSDDPGGDLDEPSFIRAVLEQCNAGLLLDLHNVYANAVNQGLDPLQLLESLPLQRTVQVHLAGGRWRGSYYSDSHDTAVPRPVWQLLRATLERVRPTAITLERDDPSAPIEEIAADLTRAHRLLAGDDTFLNQMAEAPSPAGAGRGLPARNAATIERRRGLKIRRELQRSLRTTWPAAGELCAGQWRTAAEHALKSLSPGDRLRAYAPALRSVLGDNQWRVDVDLAISELAFEPHDGPATRVVITPHGTIRCERTPDLKVRVTAG